MTARNLIVSVFETSLRNHAQPCEVFGGEDSTLLVVRSGDRSTVVFIPELPLDPVARVQWYEKHLRRLLPQKGETTT